ncbi:MAG: hydantoinase/oxoprolinase family protein [Candidatus Bathyarchaeota archaeon]|nr:hydantoinase/oxoprolinase family protein [Candidatus Bathyarchaeota archaeon]
MFRVSVDIGGTFTDLVALDEETGRVMNIKVPSVPRNPERGVTDAFKKFLEGRDADQVRMVGHATTIATNALLGQVDLDVPKVALITTKGFRDVVEIGRQRRSEVYNLFFQRPPQLVERRLRFEVDERVEHDGAVTKELDEGQLEGVLDEIKGLGVSSIAISFLNSYANSAHEERALTLAKERNTSPYLTASSHISNEYREYERTSTAVVNAALMPIIHKYLTQLESDLHSLGVGAPLYVMQSNGGLSTVANVSEKPATIVESGPAAGVIAAAWLGELAGAGDIISFDMGGTTAKAGTVRGRIPEVVPEYEVAGHIHMGRLVKGSGYPVRFPFIDLAECSSGGGTIAWADEGGALRVGPTSAGAYPGPACYGRGGTQPTITDANLLLGRLNPGNLLSGGMSIYPEKGRAALNELGEKVGLNAEEAAVSIVRIANSMMGKILRIVSVERGYDPRGFTLVAFGGAGPMHVCALAEELEVGKIIVPPNPGMFSALGLLTADMFHDYTRPIVKRVSRVDPREVEAAYREMEAEGRETLRAEGVPEAKMSFLRQADLRYLGQAYELTIRAPKRVNGESLVATVIGFHKRHAEAYGYSAEGEPVELVSLRLRAIGAIPKPDLKGGDKSEARVSGTRRVYYETDGGWAETPVIQRGEGWAQAITGPAIVEQYDATTVVYPGWRVETDGVGNLVLGRAK